MKNASTISAALTYYIPCQVSNVPTCVSLDKALMQSNSGHLKTEQASSYKQNRFYA